VPRSIGRLVRAAFAAVSLCGVLVLAGPIDPVAADGAARAADGSVPPARLVRNPFDSALLVNDDPAALPVGIRFMSTVPLETRRLILEDLTWLNELGPLPDSPLLGDLLGLAERPVTGAHLAAFVVQAVHTMVGADFCTTAARLLASGAPTELDFVDDPESRELCLEKPPREAVAWAAIQSAIGRRARQVDLVYIDGELMVPRRLGAYFTGLVAINEISLESVLGAVADVPREVRIVLLVHEAFHAMHDAYHISCDENWMLGTREMVFGAIEGPPAERDCDPLGYAGSYTIEAETMRLLAQLCEDCTTEMRETLAYYELDTWGAVGLPADQPLTFPESEALAGTVGLTGREFRIFPPRRFFEVMEEASRYTHELCEDRDCRQNWTTYLDETEELLRILDAAAETGQLPREWAAAALPEPMAMPDLDLAATTAWLAAASAAEATGYNVPLRFMVPCDQLAPTCGAIAEGLGGAENGLGTSWTGNEAAASLLGSGVYRLPGMNFDARRGKMSEEVDAILAELCVALLANPYWRVVIEAHSDDRGSASASLASSERGAETVRRYLTESGISASRIEVVGYGASRPIASNDTQAGRAENRRIEIRLAPL
jgi:outer membrane protein OmpA-like peptidoglycan-associated protein